jgi:hypothetical protein
MYIPQEEIATGPILFVDDNLSPLLMSSTDQIDPILALYDRYTGDSELNVNVRKSTVLCINCSPELMQDLQHKGFSTPETILI